jgi:hypothetical protein
MHTHVERLLADPSGAHLISNGLENGESSPSVMPYKRLVQIHDGEPYPPIGIPPADDAHMVHFPYSPCWQLSVESSLASLADAFAWRYRECRALAAMRNELKQICALKSAISGFKFFQQNSSMSFSQSAQV